MFSGSVIPMVCLPADLRDAFRERFPDCEVGKRDAISYAMTSPHIPFRSELRNVN
jgi:hypothetical protein